MEFPELPRPGSLRPPRQFVIPGNPQETNIPYPRSPFKATSKHKKNREKESICGLDPELLAQACEERKRTQEDFTRHGSNSLSFP